MKIKQGSTEKSQFVGLNRFRLFFTHFFLSLKMLVLSLPYNSYQMQTVYYVNYLMMLSSYFWLLLGQPRTTFLTEELETLHASKINLLHHRFKRQSQAKTPETFSTERDVSSERESLHQHNNSCVIHCQLQANKPANNINKRCHQYLQF